MYDISHDRPVPGPHSGRNGLTKRLRDMYKNDSFEMPSVKKASVYSAARLTGAKITVRDMGTGTAIVWRLDGLERPASIFNDGLDIFGQPITRPLTPPAVATAAAPVAPTTKKTVFD